MTATAAAPLVPGLPVLGSALDLRITRVRPFLTRAYHEHGPVFRVRAVGQELVVLAGLEANRLAAGPARHSLSSWEEWRRFRRHTGASSILIDADDPLHSRMRRVQAPSYTRGQLASRLDAAARVAQEDIDALGEGWVAAAPLCKRVIIEQVALAAIGGSGRDHMDDLVLYIQTLLMATFTQQRPAAALARPAVRRARAKALALVDRLVEERRRTGPGETSDLLDALLAAQAESPDDWSEDTLRMAVLGAFVAGMDTAANTLAFALYELTRQPELRPELVAEVDAALAGGVTSESLGRLPALTAFVHEVLRVHPVAPALTRRVVRDLELGGHRIAAGTRVILATTVTHGLPDVFAEPERFDPSRFGPERAEHRTPGAFVPFGVGPHVCAGRGMAEGLLLLDLALLLHRVELRGDPAYLLREVARPTPSPDARFRVHITPR